MTPYGADDEENDSEDEIDGQLDEKVRVWIR